MINIKLISIWYLVSLLKAVANVHRWNLENTGFRREKPPTSTLLTSWRWTALMLKTSLGETWLIDFFICWQIHIQKKRALMKLSNLRAEMEGREQSMYALQVDYLLINAKRISYTNSSWLMNTKILIKHRRWRQWCLALRKQSSGTLGWPLVIKMFDWSLWQILEWMTIMKGSLKKSWQ